MTRTSRSRVAWAPAAATVAGLGVAAVATADAGARGAVSALLGTALVVGFLASGLVPFLLVRGLEVSAALGLGLLLLNYSLRLGVAVLVLLAVLDADSLEPRWTGLAVIAGALAWAGGQAAAVLGPGEDDLAGHGPPTDGG